MHPHTMEKIETYVEIADHRDDREAFLFQSVRTAGKQLSREAIFNNVVRKYARQARVDPYEVSVHSFRATAATNAEENQSDLKEIQGWMGHSSVSTTEAYARRRVKVEESPTFKVRY